MDLRDEPSRGTKFNDLFQAENEATFSWDSHPAQTYTYSADGGSHVITVLRRSDLEVVSEFGGPVRKYLGGRGSRT